MRSVVVQLKHHQQESRAESGAADIHDSLETGAKGGSRSPCLTLVVAPLSSLLLFFILLDSLLIINKKKKETKPLSPPLDSRPKLSLAVAHFYPPTLSSLLFLSIITLLLSSRYYVRNICSFSLFYFF